MPPDYRRTMLLLSNFPNLRELHYGIFMLKEGKGFEFGEKGTLRIPRLQLLKKIRLGWKLVDLECTLGADLGESLNHLPLLNKLTLSKDARCTQHAINNTQEL